MGPDGIGTYVLEQLAYQTPTFLVCFAGIVIALVKFRRCPMPTILVIVSLLIMTGTRVVVVVTQAILLDQARNGGIGNVAVMFKVTGVASGIVYSVALGLLIAAAFVSRTPPAVADNYE